MTLFATHRSRGLWLLSLLVVVIALIGARAEAQVLPTWDHYKLYLAGPPIPANIPVVLDDQFMHNQPHMVQFLERWMNPVEKRLPEGLVFGITKPFLHYTWWRIDPAPFTATAVVTNQFGDQTLTIHDALWLLNPALKNQSGPPPNENHYKCYLCDGQPVTKQVLLTDQFDQWSAQVLFPRYFCNPAEKRVGPVPGGQVYPIIDPNQHYVCYEFQPPDPQAFPAVISDQFIQPPQTIDAHNSQWLCVPTFKQSWTANEKNTWGKLKQLYR